MSSEKKINCLEIPCRVKLSDVCTLKDADIRDDFIRVSSFLENDFMKYLEWKIENFYLLPGHFIDRLLCHRNDNEVFLMTADIKKAFQVFILP